MGFRHLKLPQMGEIYMIAPVSRMKGEESISLAGMQEVE